MPTALIYCRVSSDRQVREGHGLEGQESRCRTYALDKGYDVVGVFRDEGVSGGVIEREGMEEMLAYLDSQKSQEECIVIIDDLKRLARDLIGHFTLRKAIQSHGARLESPSHTFGEGPEEIFVESIMAATAELERNQNRKQVRNRMKARLEAGYWPFYQPPGYTFQKVPGHGKLLVPLEPDAGIIREAFEGYASGRFAAQTDVRRFLESRGFNSRLGSGRVSYAEQVKRLLTRQLYAGFISYPPWNVTARRAHHEPLVDVDTYDRVQERLNEGAYQPRRPNLQKDFPLRGFLVCADCGKPYTSSWSRGKTKQFAYYRCVAQSCPQCNRSVRADVVHARFETLLKSLKPRETILEVVRETLLSEWNRRELDVGIVRKERERKLDAIDAEIRTFVTAIGKCHNPTVMKKIEEEIDALEAKKLRLGSRIDNARKYDFPKALKLAIEFLKDPFEMWRTGDFRQRQLVLRMVFSGPLVYARDAGFGTPELSQPVAIACVPELTKLELVDIVRRSWNSLQTTIELWFPLLQAKLSAS